MASYRFVDALTRLFRDDGEDAPSLSRRDMLAGIGLVGALAVAGPVLMRPGTAEAVEVIDDGADLEDEATPVGYHWRRRRRRRRRPYRGRYRRRRYSPRRRRRPGRCEHWHNQCAHNWGYGNPDYYGCMRYHGC